MTPQQKKLYKALAKFLLKSAWKYYTDNTTGHFFHQFTSDGETLFPLLWRLDLARPFSDPKAAPPRVTDGVDCYWRLIAKPSEVDSRLKKIPPHYPALSELIRCLDLVDFDHKIFFQRAPFAPSSFGDPLIAELLEAEYLLRVDDRCVWADRVTIEMRDLWEWDETTHRFESKYKDPFLEEAVLAYLTIPHRLRVDVLRRPGVKTVARLFRDHWYDWAWTDAPRNRSDQSRAKDDAAFKKAEHFVSVMFGDEEIPKFL